MDDELLEDFLTEAGEILERLQSQLVDLEHQGDDSDLLNSIFRGFHTIKGGAGFLQILPLVDCCHVAENVFDVLRKGQRAVTPELMDVVLEALDAVNGMFEAVRERSEVAPASPELLARLTRFSEPQSADETAVSKPTALAAAPATTSKPEMAPVEAKAEKAVAATAGGATAGAADAISEDEFEALLDELHGKGGKVAAAAPVAAPVSTSGSTSASASGFPKKATDSISEAEFDALLDELHGKGGKVAGQAAATNSVVETIEAAVAKPEVTAKPSTNASKTKEGKEQKEPKENKEAADTTVRVDTRVLDRLMNMVGELVLVRNRLVRLGVAKGDEELGKAVANLDVVTADLQASVMKTRMQPIKKVFGRFPRVVRDLARQLSKEINLELIGEDTDLDKNLVDALADPLVHLVRNAVDHGVESPEVRKKAGKPVAGKVVLGAEQEGDRIKLTISDDGKGMDPELLRRKAVEKGMMDAEAAARLTPEECFDLILAPGFSTKEQISDVSGRGVGMDVVKNRINQLNGTIRIESEVGRGSRFVIKVPLTLAILPALMIVIGDQIFAIPLSSVIEIFKVDLRRTHQIDNREVVVVRGKAIPLYHLNAWLSPNGVAQQAVGTGHVVIVHVGTQAVGFVVDHLIGQEEVVIKPLGKTLQGTAGLAGATITGDGRVALILDVPSLVRRYG